MRRTGALAALAGALALGGCAAPARTTPGTPASPEAGRAQATVAHPDSAVIVLELRMRRSAELADDRGAIRVLDQDLSVEFRIAGRGPGLDAGEVTLEGRTFQRTVNSKGNVRYRLGREAPTEIAHAGEGPWSTLAASGGARVPAGSTRVKLAPFPIVTRPAPGQAALRSEELAVIMLPPVPEVWYRVTLVGAGDPVAADDLGEGRWHFARGSLERLGAGRAKVLIEVETSCGDCPVGGRMRANWSTRSELEIPLTLL